MLVNQEFQDDQQEQTQEKKTRKKSNKKKGDKRTKEDIINDIKEKISNGIKLINDLYFVVVVMYYIYDPQKKYNERIDPDLITTYKISDETKYIYKKLIPLTTKEQIKNFFDIKLNEELINDDYLFVDVLTSDFKFTKEDLLVSNDVLKADDVITVDISYDISGETSEALLLK